MAESPSRRLAAIMFTDIVGFTALTQEDEAAALRLLDRHNRLLRPVFPRHQGTEIKAIGDSFLVEFPSALGAVGCAIEILRTLAEVNAATEVPHQIHLRIGIHLGDVVHSSGDVFGDAVNVASRMEPLAESDGICVSEPVFEQVRNKLDAGFEPLPPSDLKNVRYPLAVYRVRWSPTGGPPTGGRRADGTDHRLAVLPFANLSPDAADEYFADGLTEELISELAHLPGCQVIARTSVIGYKTAPKAVKEVGRALGIDVALEGSVRKSGNRLRITAQLIDARSEVHLWSDRYDRELREVFDLQSEIATRVAEALKVQLAPRVREEMSKPRTGNLEAYQSYLKGRQLWWLGGEASYRAAIDCFERAVALDPDFALAYCGLSDSWALLGNHGYVPLPEAIATAERAARKALDLAPDLADAHVSLAPILYNRYDWRGAIAELRRAVALDPNSVLGHYWLAVAVSVLGNVEEALEISRKTAALDPLSRQSVLQPAIYLFENRDYQGSIDYAEDVERRLGFHAPLYRGASEMFLGRYEVALPHLREAAAGAHGNLGVRRAMLAIACFRAGQEGEGRTILAALLEEGRAGRIPAGVLGMVYAAIGENDAAFEWFERAYVDRSVLEVEDLRVDPYLDGIRTDPRYAPLLKKFHLADPD